MSPEPGTGEHFREFNPQTFKDYFAMASTLYHEIKANDPGSAPEKHPYIRALNSLTSNNKELYLILADQLLPPEDVDTYRRHLEGPKAFGVNDDDEDLGDEWRGSVKVNNELVRTVNDMQLTGKVPEHINMNIPEELRGKLTRSLQKTYKNLQELLAMGKK